MIRSKADEQDVALGIILQDPILFAEFMRTTRDGAKDPQLWSKRPYKYRFYQRDLISDKSDSIILTGGRAIGKCAAGSNRLLTLHGYKTHSEMKNKRFVAWTLTEDGEMVLKPAVCVPNGRKYVKTITTESNYCLSVTYWHPILTRNGYKMANYLKEGEEIAVVTKLPHVPAPYEYSNDDIRLLGYLLFQDIRMFLYIGKEYPIKSTSVRKDLEGIFARKNIKNTYFLEHNTIRIDRIKRTAHPINHLFNYFDLHFVRKFGWYRDKEERTLSSKIMELGESNLKNFLEAILAQYATITTQDTRLTVPSLLVAKQFQELFLRFGIETRFEHTDKTINKTQSNRIDSERYWNIDIVTRDSRAQYRLLTQLTIPGYRIGNIPLPPQSFDVSEHYRFEKITRIKNSMARTYAVQVEKHHTYVIENVHTHNSVVLEDKILFDVVNNERQLIETPELVLTTANQNQLTPLLDHLRMRVYSSPILRPFVSGGLNQQKGTFDFNVHGRDVRIHARLAGQRGESNVVGLHLPRAIIDEG